MASLVIAALPVHSAATILLAATSKSPIKAATTDVREDDLLRLNVAFVLSMWPSLHSPRSRGCFSAVDAEDSARDERRLVGCQTSDRLGDFIGFARTFERHARNQAGLSFSIAGEPVKQFGINRTWCDSVDAHTERRAFERRCLGESFDRVLACSVQ